MYDVTRTVAQSLARALFVCAWADREEENDRHYPGQDFMDLAPETPNYAYETALLQLGAIEQANGMSTPCLIVAAAKADHMELEDSWEIPDDYVKDFGHYLGMMSLGHGVSWFDDHNRFTVGFMNPQEFKTPYIDNLELED